MLYYFAQLNLKLLLVIIVFGMIMSKTRQIASQNFLKKASGYYIMDFFNLVGTPVHEFGHLFFGLLFGYHIDKICLYRSTKKAMRHGGALGFVKMHHKRETLFQQLTGDAGQFFIGIGPLLLGPATILLIGHFLPDNLKALPSAFQDGAQIFLKALQQLSGTDIIIMFVYLYINIGISLNMELSRQDLHLAWKGLFLLELFFFMLSASAFLFQWDLNIAINLLFQWNLLISSVGIICSLMANLIALI